MIHILNKKLGETPLECIERFRVENPEYESIKMTYAGRLDPMAEGVLIVLSGEDVKEKEKYLGLPKTYEFEILWGFETDSLDILGLISLRSSSEQTFFRQILRRARINRWYDFAQSRLPACEAPPQDLVSTSLLKKYIGKSVQKYPNFSSKPINGTPLFQLARDSGLEGVEIPEHEVEIFNAEFLGRREVDKEELLKNIEDKINLVKGDFRQEEILKTWQEVLGPKDNSNTDSVQETKFIIDKIKMKVSSGFYIRQFVSDLSKELNFPAVTFHIKRTSVGDFSF